MRKPHATPPDSPMSVLFVDDSPDIRATMIRMVRPLGLNILEADDGQVALDILKRQRVDVVLSDLVMPRMSGMMLLHSMLELGLATPFILATGFSDKDSAIQALRLGAFDYLEKPIDETDLQTVLVEALKVSHEQTRMLAALNAASTGDETAERRAAETQIVRMRALRVKGEPGDHPVSQGVSESWSGLRDLFVQEADPQLIFCEGALKGMGDPESQPSRDLAFVLRVLQSIRMAAEAVRVNHIATFAWTVETAVAACKVGGLAPVPAHIEALVDGTRALRAMIDALSDPAARRISEQLDAMTEHLRGD